ncbi:MAG: RluA family pseudouridine synthase [Alphaproteobacteria bacterium]|nr:RluA family pseudouridine synthase [Alphaproteobacteria bacterium]
MSGVRQQIVARDEADMRVDKWFQRHFPDLPFGRLAKLLRTGQVRVDSKRVKPGDRVQPGQSVRIPPLGAPVTREKPAVQGPSKADLRLAEDLKRRILFKDAEVLVIDKPAGLAVQGGSNTTRHLDGVLELLKLGADEAPRLVHRLDKDTSGVLVLGRTRQAAQWLTHAFRRKETEKVYWALTVGVPEVEGGKIDLPLGKQGSQGQERVGVDEDAGKRAVTHYQVLETAGKKAAFLALRPITGRTHQLRAHMAALGTPIHGDGKYGGRAAFLDAEELPKKMHLHARHLRINRPDGGVLEATAPLPDHMRTAWALFGFDPDAALPAL